MILLNSYFYKNKSWSRFTSFSLSGSRSGSKPWSVSRYQPWSLPGNFSVSKSLSGHLSGFNYWSRSLSFSGFWSRFLG